MQLSHVKFSDSSKFVRVNYFDDETMHNNKRETESWTKLPCG